MKKEILKFEIDITGALGKFFTKIQNEYFPKLTPANINVIFRTVAKTDDEGFTVLGEARKLSNRERDLYNFDFEICVHKRTWKGLDSKQRERLAWHELNHCIVKYNVNKPKRDKAGRIMIVLRRHDIVIKTFMKEIKKFGPTKSEQIVIKKIQEYSKKRGIKRRKK